ncbi:MAG: FAD-dependent oxidoreductase, partial [Solirubrobacteraceae bacterium]
AQLRLARRDGAQLRLGERVLRWSASADGVSVTTDSGTHHGGQLLLCAGAWIPELVPETRDLLAVHRQLLYWFPIRHGYRRLRDMPAFIWDLAGDRDGFVHLDGFYGLPAVDGAEGGVKIGVESYEQTTTPDGRQHPPTAAEIEHIQKHVVAPHLPWLGPEPVRTASCLYTCARDCRFLVDRHPAHESVLIVSACSGHGFKHSPAIGEAVAQWLTGDDVQIDLSPFGFARHAAASLG